MNKIQFKVLKKLSELICSEIKNKRNLSFEDKIQIVDRFLKKYKSIKKYDFEKDVPCSGSIGAMTHLKDSVRIQLKCGYGKYNYSDAVRIYFEV